MKRLREAVVFLVVIVAMGAAPVLATGHCGNPTQVFCDFCDPINGYRQCRFDVIYDNNCGVTGRTPTQCDSCGLCAV
jgi:hypothetical protein